MMYIYQTRYPVVNAIIAGNIQEVKKCIATDDRFEKRSNDYLISACLQGHTDIVHLLFAHGANASNEALHAAASRGHTNLVKLLLDKGLDVNSEHSHALICATQGEHLETVELLLRCGADRSTYDFVPLQIAKAKGNQALCKLLCPHSVIEARKPSQARPVDLSSRLPGKKLHLKSIASGLRRVRLNLMYCTQSLQYYFSADRHAYDEDAVSYTLRLLTVQLEGLLDGLIICGLNTETSPDQTMSFQRTPFTNQRLLDIQTAVKGLHSAHSTNTTSYANFWTIANFWRHYFPCSPRPIEIGNLLDFEIDLRDGGKSGPLIHDLILPTFNHTCSIVGIVGVQLGMDRDDWYVSRIDPVVLV